MLGKACPTRCAFGMHAFSSIGDLLSVQQSPKPRADPIRFYPQPYIHATEREWVLSTSMEAGTIYDRCLATEFYVWLFATIFLTA